MTAHAFEFRQNHIYVPVTIGEDIQGEFLLDTGASQTVISTSFLGRVKLPINGIRGSNAMALGGLIDHSVEGITLPSLTCAGQTIADLEVTQVNANPLKAQFGTAPDGVLGVNFLRHFEITINYPARTIELRPLPADGDLDAFSRLAEDAPGIRNAHLRNDWLFELEGRINDEINVTMLLDLGAPRSILNWNAARALGLTPESPQLRKGKHPLRGMDGRTLEPLYMPPTPVSIGSLTWPNCVLAIADTPIIKQLHVRYIPILVLGNDLLSQFELVLNYPMARVGFYLPTSADSTAA